MNDYMMHRITEEDEAFIFGDKPAGKVYPMTKEAALFMAQIDQPYESQITPLDRLDASFKRYLRAVSIYRIENMQFMVNDEYLLGDIMLAQEENEEADKAMKVRFGL